MQHESTARQRTAGVFAEAAMVTALHVAVPVRLLDLNSGGLLLASKVPLRAGSTVRVAIDLAGRRLDVELCVDRVSSRRDEAVGGYVLSARLPSLEPAAWRRLRALVPARVSGTADERASRAA